MNISGLVLLMVALPAAWCADWDKVFPVTGRPRLRISSTEGAVSIRFCSCKQVELHVTADGWEIAAGEVQVEGAQNGALITLDVRAPKDSWALGRASLRIDVQTPRDADADVLTKKGAIEVEGLRGTLRLITGTGGITARSVDGGVEARTGDGALHLRGRLDLLTAHTGDGNMDVEIGPGSRLSGPWKIDTGSGSVDVRLPQGLAANLELQTGAGKIALNPPIAVVTSDHGRRMKGALNGGGAVFSIRTRDGSVRIQTL